MIFSKGKYEKPARRVRKRSALLLLSLVLILAMSVGGTVAFLATKTDGLTNTFVPGTISTDIEESFNRNQKTSAVIKNTGEINAYVRARVIVNWVKDGNVVPGEAKDVSYNISNTSKWTEGADGYYYYNSVLAPGGATDSLINPITLEEKDGAKMEVTILSQAIQAEGGAVEELWGTAAVTALGLAK